MENKYIGIIVMVGSIVALLLYGFFIFFTDYSFWLITVTAFIVVAGVLIITAWIGYTLFTTPLPEPLNMPLDVSENIEEAGAEG
jgi:general stress protein CsbA